MSDLKSSEKIQIAKEIVALLEAKDLYSPDVCIGILKVVVKAICNDCDIKRV